MNKKIFLSVVAVLVVTAASAAQTFAQCGVYLKRTTMQSFPISKVHVDRAVEWTGDNFPDLLVSETQDGSYFSRTRTFVLPNLGNGTFGTPIATVVPPASTPTYSGIWDFRANNDAHKDLLLFFGSLSSSFRIMVNNGDGTFTAGALISTATLGYPVGIFDLNGDGFDDYIGRIGNSPYQVMYSEGNGDGTIDPPVQIFDHSTGNVGDYNGDGKMDFLDGGHLHLNQGNVTFNTVDVTGWAGTGSDVVWGQGDFNNDGKHDLLMAPLNGTRQFTTVISTGAGFNRTTYNVSTDTNWTGFPTAENVSGNSATDVIFHPQNLAKKAVYTSDGSGNLTRQDYDGRWFTYNQQTTAAADFDNDGKVDHVRGSSATSNSRIMLRDITSLSFLKNVCDKPGQPNIVDYDYSGTTDWSFWNPATGDWSHRTNTTNRELLTQQTINWGLGSLGDIPTPGDFDGDGITDRAVYRDSTGYWYIRRSSDAGWFVMRFGLTGDKPVVADYDGDTISDIAVWRPSDGNWYIWYMGPQSFHAQHFGSDGDKPAPADFDGDQKADIAVYRPSTGVWYYYKSTDGNYVVMPWGISTDKPIPADFDGDGKADIAVYRESDKFAYIIRSTTGAPSYYQFGLAGDVLQVGDYDGDNVADLGVYRPSNQTWWLTTFPFAVSQQYGVSGAIPTSSTVKSD